MPSAADPLDLLSRSLEQAGTLIAGIRPEQATRPTPCRAWDVRGLVNHLVADVLMFAARTGGGQSDQRGDDVLGDDWSAAYRQAADSLLEVWRRPGALDGTIQLPFGEAPASWSVQQQAANFVVHAWDIAEATGQQSLLDPELGQTALGWGRENLQPKFRGDEASGSSFGPEVQVPADAPVYDRLGAFFGRTPGFGRTSSGPAQERLHAG